MQVDIARLLILKVCGGFWLDLKMYPVCSFLDSLREYPLVLAEHFVKPGWYPGLPCSAFLGAVPGHPFFDTVISLALENVKQRAPHTFAVAGPAALDLAVKKQLPSDLHMLPHTDTWEKLFKVGSGSYNNGGLHWSEREQKEPLYVEAETERKTVTRQEIIDGYVFLLGRHPNETEISMWQHVKSVDILRQDFFKSDEFSSMIADFGFVPKNAAPLHKVRPVSPKVKIAALTRVYNESDLLPLWLRYYGSQVGVENCFVVDDVSDDGSTYNLMGANRIRLPSSGFDITQITKQMCDLSSALLSSYDYVIRCDVDEFIVPDPMTAPSLKDYCQMERKPVTTAIGLNVVHSVGSELPLDPRSSLLLQRPTAFPVASMYKPAVIRCSVKWSEGFHCYDGPIETDGLYLFHVAYADLDIALRRQAKRRGVVANHPNKQHHHRASDDDVRAWINSWSKLPLGDDNDLEQFTQAVVASQAGRENQPYRINLDLWGKKAWRIPDRFRRAF